jgi:hypothetical protein
MKESFFLSWGNSLWNISWKWQNVSNTQPEIILPIVHCITKYVASTTYLLSDNPTHHWILKVLKFKSLELRYWLRRCSLVNHYWQFSFFGQKLYKILKSILQVSILSQETWTLNVAFISHCYVNKLYWHLLYSYYYGFPLLFPNFLIFKSIALTQFSIRILENFDKSCSHRFLHSSHLSSKLLF